MFIQVICIALLVTKLGWAPLYSSIFDLTQDSVEVDTYEELLDTKVRYQLRGKSTELSQLFICLFIINK